MAPSAAHKAARWALGQMATRAQIEAMAAGRQLVEGSATSWRRVTDSDPCGFCAMLASRGPVYQSRAAALDAAGRGSAVQSMYRADGSRKSGGTAKGVKARGARQLGEKYHAYCGCTAEPFYGSWEEWEPTPEEQVYRQAYEAANWYNIDDLELPTKIHTLLHDPTSATPEMFERFVTGMDERQFKALTKKWRANGVSTRGLKAVWTKANPEPELVYTGSDAYIWQISIDGMSEDEAEALMFRYMDEGDLDAAERVGELLEARPRKQPAAWTPDAKDAYNPWTFEWFDTLDDDAQDAFLSTLGHRDAFLQEQWSHMNGRAVSKRRVNIPPEREIRAAYADYLENLWPQVEESTHGFYKRGMTGKPADLWRVNANTARSWASEELKRWWDDNGRMTYRSFKAGYTGDVESSQEAMGRFWA